MLAVIRQKNRGKQQQLRHPPGDGMPNEPPGAQPCELATQDIIAGPGRQLQRQGAHADLRSSRISRPVEDTLLLGRLEEHIRKARKDIRALAEGKKDIVQIGGMEALASKINLAALRRDSSGKLDSAGYARFTEAGSKTVDRTIQLCLNSVLISGLILSIGFAIAFGDIVASDESIEFFGGSNASSAISALYTLHHTCLILAISSNPGHQFKSGSLADELEHTGLTSVLDPTA